ncbi:uncharacterized protein LOC142588992 [Dermacentor variabilis]|uniref:uncharacterized protein LOC142588992 n=1 Tax=Dermacentor variabilis TaxID=34621 RepID=UPI003F5B661A
MLHTLCCFLAPFVVLAAELTTEPPMYADQYEAYKYEDATKVLNYNGTVHLYRASYGWNPDNTKCMKSNFMEKQDKLVHRTIEYYGIPVRNTAFGYQVMKLWMKVIKPEEKQPYIYAAENRSEVEQRKPEVPKKTPPTKPPTTLAPRSLDGDGTTLLENVYMEYVLYSDDKCVLIGAYNQTERVSCSLWVTQAAINNPLSHCNFLLTALCGNPAYNAYKYEKKICGDYDKILRSSERS